MAEEEILWALENLDESKFIEGIGSIMPHYVEHMGSSYDLYHREGFEDPDVKMLIDELAQAMFKTIMVIELTMPDLLYDMEWMEPGELEVALEELDVWLEGTELSDDGLSMSRDVFKQFLTMLLSVDVHEIEAGETGPVEENGTWHVQLTIRDSKYDEELMSFILGFDKVDTGWIMDLFQLDVSLFLDW